jgi:hypothetical protein
VACAGQAPNLATAAKSKASERQAEERERPRFGYRAVQGDTIVDAFLEEMRREFPARQRSEVEREAEDLRADGSGTKVGKIKTQVL